MKKKLWKIWKGWLVISIPVNVISLAICACTFDSEHWLPIFIGMINLVWLLIITEANTEKENRRKDNKDNGTKDKEHICTEFQGDKAANL